MHGRYSRARARSVRAARGAWLAILAAGAAGAEANLSFEALSSNGGIAAWQTSGDGSQVYADDTVAAHGARSLRIASGESERGARATLRIAAPNVAGNRLRVGVLVRTEQVVGSASLRLRIDGAEGLLYVDGLADTASGTTDWTRYTVEAPVFTSAAWLEVNMTLQGTGAAWFDDVVIEGFDTAGLPPPAPAASRYVERALRIIEEHSIMRASIDWPRFRRNVLAHARGAVTVADAYLALRYALGSLGDHHSYLSTPDRAAALERAPVSNARTGRPAVAPSGQRLGAGISYVLAPGFAGGSHGDQVDYAERLQGVIRGLDEPPACGWMVDLRSNSGGNVWPMLAGVGPLLEEGEIAAANYSDGRRVSLWYREGKAGLGDYVQLRVRGGAYRLRHPAPHVAVLLGPRTASSAEVLAIGLAGAPARRSFGAPTRGLSTGNRTFELSDGARLVLAVAATSDSAGRLYNGPIEPDEAVPAGRAGGATLAEQPDVQAALQWLQRQCG